MNDVLSLPVLVLNRHLVPVQVTTVKRAIVLMYGGAALALDEGGDSYDFEVWRDLPVRKDDDAIPVVGGGLRVPRVVHLLRYDRTPRVTVRLTRRNLMFRDAQQCQYCGKRMPTTELSLDHVVPKSQGGKSSWTNIVCCCVKCNVKKGGRTPEQAHMHLITKPIKPKRSPVINIRLADERYQSWKQFLDDAYWTVELK